jgi:hypothetical protein
MPLINTSPETVYATKGNILIPKTEQRPGESGASAVARLKAKGEADHAASLGTGAAVTLPTPKVEV